HKSNEAGVTAALQFEKLLRRSDHGKSVEGWIVNEANKSGLGAGGLHPGRDFRTEPREILCVPSINGPRSRLERTMTEQGVVNRAAGETEAGGGAQHSEVFLIIEADNCHPLA